MRILILSPIFPDAPSDGDRLRLYHFMRELAARHELVLACFTDPSRREDGNAGALKDIASEIHRIPMPRSMQWLNAGLRIARQTPSNVAAYASREMRILVDRLLSYIE